MKIRTIALVAVLVVIAFTMLEAMITRDGVGPIEYVTGALLVVALLALAVRVSRHALQRG
jgi:protein-S-isoprenylcysteine O-methyltransferase Ste14